MSLQGGWSWRPSYLYKWVSIKNRFAGIDITMLNEPEEKSLIASPGAHLWTGSAQSWFVVMAEFPSLIANLMTPVKYWPQLQNTVKATLIDKNNLSVLKRKAIFRVGWWQWHLFLVYCCHY